MTINWDAVAAIVELLGLLLIVVSVVYVAIQTRSINKQSQAEARYAFVEAVGQINMVIAQDVQASSVFRRGLASAKDLSDDESMQFFMLIGQYANVWSVMHQSYIDDVLPETQWQIVKNDVASLMGSPGGRYFWENGGKAAFGDEFAAFVNGVLQSAAQPYDMVKLTERGG